jgi:hypothetical protein
MIVIQKDTKQLLLIINILNKYIFYERKSPKAYLGIPSMVISDVVNTLSTKVLSATVFSLSLHGYGFIIKKKSND